MHPILRKLLKCETVGMLFVPIIIKSKHNALTEAFFAPTSVTGFVPLQDPRHANYGRLVCRGDALPLVY